MPKRLTTNDFIKKAKKIHGNKYNYSLVEYKNAKTKVKIICPVDDHGIFEQTPNDHCNSKRPCGCMKCHLSKVTKTSEQFIIDSKKIHGDRYDYSKVKYINNDTNVKIICSIHGEFLQLPKTHLKGGNCQICAGVKKMTKESFTEKSIKVHGLKYNYSNVEYENNLSKVSIICPKHGEFLQSPSSHLQGHGCPSCSGRGKLNTEDFIRMSRLTHGDKYDYSKVKYKGIRTPVIIICPINGEFEEIPHKHFKYGVAHAKYDMFINNLTSIGIKCKRSKKDSNVLEVQCYRCKKWFIPTVSKVRCKIKAANNTEYGEANLYCSEHCKSQCPVFNFHSNQIDPRSILHIEKTEQQQARSCQTKIIKQLQCQTDGKLHCEICGNEIYNMDAELHHTLPIAKFGLKASDHESQILLCTRCHLESHAECR